MHGWKQEVIQEKKGGKYDTLKLIKLQEELLTIQLPILRLKADLIIRLKIDDIEQDGPSNQEEDDMLVLTSENCYMSKEEE
eukprot:4966758-Ditylum_brightwellii.AAC.1